MLSTVCFLYIVSLSWCEVSSRKLLLFAAFINLSNSSIGLAISEPVAVHCDSLVLSGGQCHLIHLTILRMLSWPSLSFVIASA